MAIITREDIARKCGLSVSTVAYALSNHPRISQATRERVAKVSQELGYAPSQAARRLVMTRHRKQSRVLEQIAFTVVSPEETLLKESHVRILSGAEIQTALLGAILVLVRVLQDSDWEKIQRLVSSGSLDGIVLLGHLDREVATRLKSLPVPWVSLGSHQIPENIPNVNYDDEEAGRLAAEYLVKAGHKKIAFLGPRQVVFPYQESVCCGFNKVVKAAGVEVPAPACSSSPSYPAHFDRLLELRPSAVFAAEPGYAARFVAYSKTKGVEIPRDLALISMEIVEADAAEGCPFIRLCSEEVGAAGIRLLKDLCSNPGTIPPPILIPPAFCEPTSPSD
jgi:LacI family transcriptional regulator